MTAIKFDKSVRYKGIRYPAHVVFEVDNCDLEAMKQAGAIVMRVVEEEPKKPVAAVQEPVAEPAVEAPAAEEPKMSIEEIREMLLASTSVQIAEFAKKENINLMGKTRKADMFNIIVEAMKAR